MQADGSYDGELTLNGKERHGLRYIGGFFLHKLHKKFKNSKNWAEDVPQKCMSFLCAGRLLDTEDSNPTQSVFALINRGGLWRINSNMETILLTAEKCFQNETKMLVGHRIDFMQILQSSMENKTVQRNIHDLADSAELEIDINLAQDFTKSILELYIRV